ncbi:acyl-CoA synthetase [Solihabitans fulvus]|uniref:Acyl-CoA synthetase n=1 Tax=Solihabitans fulvus TaxID=1892852 RepID=A0A5B2X9D9_9PSEU|nr:acyl-CoA synthetase [Solihabitans fulvus]KAA2260087.1 acyl-CoA synthetase [Solihabitans fulvus]
MTTSSSAHDLLWPHYAGPEDLAAIEAVPLERRGLPDSTYDLVTGAARQWPDRIALSLLPSAARWDEPVVWTFTDLADRVHRIANVLTSLGIGRRDAVGLLSPNVGTLFAATLAAEAVGIAAPVNPALAAEQVAELLTLSGAKLLVAAGPELAPAAWDRAVEVAKLAGIETVLALRPDGATDDPPPLSTGAYLDDLAAEQPGDRLLAADRPTATDLASYFHTGGTTGTPKLAAHTHGNEVAMSWTLAAEKSLGDGAVYLGGLPLFHVNAVLVTGLGPLMAGQQVVWAGPTGYRDPALYQHFWKIVERYRVTTFSAVPTVYAVLGQVPVDADLSSLQFGVVGAAPLPPAVADRFTQHTGVPLVQGYGLTEATCATARNYAGHQREGSVGQRLPYQQIKAVRVDEETGAFTDLPPGETGTLVISGPTVFPGYLRQGPDGPVPEATGKVVDGWLDTGDLGRVDEDGYVYLSGRRKDLIIRGGHNIDPAVIEDALLAHPAVTGAAAVGRPDAHSGEVPVAYVTLQPDATVTVDELLAWAAEHVPEPAAAPKLVTVLAELPLTAVGKPFKPALRKDALRTVVSEELAALGLSHLTVDVVLDGSDPVAVIGGPAEEAEVEAIRQALGRYTCTWRLSG